MHVGMSGCDFQRGAGLRAARVTTEEVRVQRGWRDKIMQVRRLSGCENLVFKRE